MIIPRPPTAVRRQRLCTRLQTTILALDRARALMPVPAALDYGRRSLGPAYRDHERRWAKIEYVIVQLVRMLDALEAIDYDQG